MGWKGTVRSLNSAIRAADRNAKQRQRELEKREKQYEKMQELEQASYEVEVYKNEIEIIQSIHKDCSDYINWEAIANSIKPLNPIKNTINEDNAKEKLKNYIPGFIDKLFKLKIERIKKLESNIEKSMKKDELIYYEFRRI